MFNLIVDTRVLRGTMGHAELTQKELAARAGISAQTVGNVLRNKVADLDTLAAMTNVLNSALESNGSADVTIVPKDLLMSEVLPDPVR